MRDKKHFTITNAFQKILNKKSKGRDPNKIWVDKRSEFYNNSFKKWLKNNNIEMYSIHNKGKSVVAKRFIKTLRPKIYKYMTSVSKNVYIDKLDDIANENELMLKMIHILAQCKALMIKILNLKFVIM